MNWSKLIIDNYWPLSSYWRKQGWSDVALLRLPNRHLMDFPVSINCLLDCPCFLMLRRFLVSWMVNRRSHNMLWPRLNKEITLNSEICLQALSSTEAFSSFLPQEFLGSGSQSISASSFQEAFSSIYYDCSKEWNKATSWANVSSRLNDADFCAKQAMAFRQNQHTFGPLATHWHFVV